MPQTTGAVTGVNCVVEILIGAVWTNISGSSNQVSNTEQNRMSGQGYTFEGDVAIVTAAKREPIDVSFRVVFSSAVDEAWQLLRTFFETPGGAPINIRWTTEPGGLTHQIANGVLSRFNYPAAVSDDPNPITCEMTIRAPQITTS
jgi:hypothetical protein